MAMLLFFRSLDFDTSNKYKLLRSSLSRSIGRLKLPFDQCFIPAHSVGIWLTHRYSCSCLRIHYEWRMRCFGKVQTLSEQSELSAFCLINILSQSLSNQ